MTHHTTLLSTSAAVASAFLAVSCMNNPLDPEKIGELSSIINSNHKPGGCGPGENGPEKNIAALFPAADATVRADLDVRMNDNHGLEAYLTVGCFRDDRNGQPDGIRSLLRFDIPEDVKSVTRATLKLVIAGYITFSDTWYDYAPDPEHPQHYKLVANRIIASGERTPWLEGNGIEDPACFQAGAANVDEAYGVAWSGNGDSGDANNLSQPDFDAAIEGFVEFYDNTALVGDTISIDITNLVQGWADGSVPNFGLMLRDIISDDGFFKQVYVWSKETCAAYADRNTAAPQLEIEFE